MPINKIIKDMGTNTYFIKNSNHLPRGLSVPLLISSQASSGGSGAGTILPIKTADAGRINIEKRLAK